MSRFFVILCVVGVAYFAYANYGYRYVLSQKYETASSDMTIGNENADIRILAYMDYNSSASNRLFALFVNLVTSDPDVKIIIRPVKTENAASQLATHIALAAKKQGDFMRVNNAFLTQGGDLDTELIRSLIRSLGLNYKRLHNAAGQKAVKEEATGYQSEVTVLNIPSLPFFFIEHVKMPNDVYSLSQLRGVIDDLRSGRR